ncbi:MAG: peptidase S14 [Ruminococcaceae bacterium]|nr:peptidase S14 [Oscillospiraceae bacterium]
MTEQTRPAQQQEENREETQQLVDLGSATITNSHGTVHCLTIIGQIEGHSTAPNNAKTTKYEHVLPLLASLEQSEEVDGLLVLLNTVGGDVEAGLAIAEMIAGMTKPTVTLVLGGGHSIGIPLAVSARRTFIAPSASMTIHPVRMTGMVIASPQTYHYFERLQESIVRFVSCHSGIQPGKFRELMLHMGDMSNDVGTIVYGEEAVSLGLMDRVGTLSDALACLYEMMEAEKRE